MKIIFGFNDIRQDGMGSEAIHLMRTIRAQGIAVQPVHPWKAVFVPGYIEEFNPIFIRTTEQEPRLEDVVSDMVAVINSDPDCTFFSHFGLPNWASVLPYLRHDIKVIVSVHSITPSALKIALAYRQRVSAFIAISRGIESKLEKSLGKTMRDRIRLITNAVDSNIYKPVPRNESGDIVKIVFFGRIEDVTKGCDKIPPIARKLKDRGVKFQWDFYGYFHWGYEPRFSSLNKKYEVEDVVRYKGCLAPEEVPTVISQYDIMVMPSNHEGFGLALAEAMSSGLACVASLIPDVTDMIMESGKEGYLVGRNDIQGFANAIERLASDKEHCKKIGRAARKKVQDQFDLTVQGQRYKDLFLELNDNNNYSIISPKEPLDSFSTASIVKPHVLARVMPLWLKRILKKIV